MARTYSAETTAVTKEDGYAFIYLVELYFDTATVYVTTAPRTVSWGGNDYLGVGNLGGVSGIQEKSGLEAPQIQLTLSGLDKANLAIALNEHYVDREVRIYAAFLTADGKIYVGNSPTFEGMMDTMPIELGSPNTVSIIATSHWARWSIPKGLLFNDEDHRSRYPGDDAFKFTAQSVDKEIVWGVG